MDPAHLTLTVLALAPWLETGTDPQLPLPLLPGMEGKRRKE